MSCITNFKFKNKYKFLFSLFGEKKNMDNLYHSEPSQTLCALTEEMDLSKLPYLLGYNTDHFPSKLIQKI